jgi:hypothetical protein
MLSQESDGTEVERRNAFMEIQNRTGLRRLFAMLAFALALVCSGAGVAFGAPYNDTEGHWGAAVIEKWSEYGVLHGNGDGSFAPDRDMSVAEFATVLVNAFGCTETGNAGISPSIPAWARGNVQKTVTAGMIAAGETGLPLTRELAAKILANALGVTPQAGAAGFADDSAVSAAYKPYVNALGKLGVFKGDAAGNFLPKKGFTRAELMQVLENAVTDIVRESKPASADKSLLVNTSGVELGAGTVKGDLIIGQGVGDGDVTLTDVKIEGRLIVYGGGGNTIRIRGGSAVPAIVLNKTFGEPVRVVFDEAARGGTVSVVAESEARVEGSVAKIEAAPRTVVTETGEITAAPASRETRLEIANGTVAELNIDAANVAVTLAGSAKVTSLVVAGANTEIAVTAGATVTAATVAARDVSIEGTGKVTSVTVTEGSAGGVAVTVPGARIKNESGAAVAVGTDKTVDAGASGNVPSTSGSGSGGSSSNNNNNNHTHNNNDGDNNNSGDNDTPDKPDVPAVAAPELADSSVSYETMTVEGKDMLATVIEFKYKANLAEITKDDVTLKQSGEDTAEGSGEETAEDSGTIITEWQLSDDKKTLKVTVTGDLAAGEDYEISVTVRAEADVTKTKKDAESFKAVSGIFARPAAGSTVYKVTYADENGVVQLKTENDSDGVWYYAPTSEAPYKIFNAVYAPNKDVVKDDTKAVDLFFITLGNEADGSGDKIELKGTAIPNSNSAAAPKEIHVGIPNADNASLPEFIIPPGALGDGSSTYSGSRIVVNAGAYLNIDSDQTWTSVFGGDTDNATQGKFNSGNITVKKGGKLRDSAYKLWPLGAGSTLSVLEGGFLAVGKGTGSGAWADSDVSDEETKEMAASWYGGWLIGDANAKIHLGSGGTTESFVEAIEVRDGFVMVNGYATVKRDISLMYDVLLTRGSEVTIAADVTMLTGKSGGGTYDFYGQPETASPSFSTPNNSSPSAILLKSDKKIINSSLGDATGEVKILTGASGDTRLDAGSSGTQATGGWDNVGTFYIFTLPEE